MPADAPDCSRMKNRLRLALSMLFVAVAAVALAALLLQPLCETFESNAGDPASCCVSVDEAPPVPSLVASLSPGKAFIVAASVALPATPFAGPAGLGPAPPARIISCLPYHARTQRNLS